MSSSTSGTWRPGTPLGGTRHAGGRAREEEVLDRPGSGRVQKVAALARRSARRKYGRFLVEGPQAVREAVRYAWEDIHDVYLTAQAAARHPEIEAEARDRGVYVHRGTDAVLTAMSPDAQGVLAVVGAAAVEREPQGGLAQWAAGARLVVVLAQAQDPGNAGTIIRAADAAGADAVVLARGSVELTSPKVVRATAGSVFHLPVFTGLELDEVLEDLRAGGVQVLAADGGGEVSLFEADSLLARRSAWLFGNEARGLTPEQRAQADAVVSVPIYGQAESLNVAAAATVCLYGSARVQRELAGPDRG